MKKCSKCKEEKKLNEFHNAKSGKFGKHHYCKICLSENKKKHYNYEKANKRRLMYSYQISLEEVNLIFEEQNKKCKICNSEYKIVAKHGGLYIDHCHSTGNVRGLLCSKCNALLGLSQDNIVILKNAIKYLEES